MTNNKLPKMFDAQQLLAAGIDPKTGLPIKLDDLINCTTKSDIRKQLRVLDEQTAVNRFTWYNLPKGLNSQLIERILYYRGQGMFFKLQDKFYFLPYALNGTIDVYGRFTEVTPLPFNGKSSPDEKEKAWITGLTRKCLYEMELPEDYISDEGEILVEKILETQENCCVLIKDYIEQASQTNISRQILQDPILDIMSEMIPFMRTALLNGTGVNGMRVDSQDDYSQVELAAQSVTKAALTGKRWIPTVGHIEFQEFGTPTLAKAEEYLLALQSLDNYRLSLYGLDNGGLFQKKSHMLEAEQEMNTGNTGLILSDSLKHRQNACTIINSIWGLNMWCMPSEAVLGIDTSGDMIVGTEGEINGQTTQEGEEEGETSDDMQ